MANDIVAALSRFRETLADRTVDGRSKLKILYNLIDVELTLSELSSSGVSRSVRLLKSEPGELGKAARDLVIKWKSLLDEHMRSENIVLEPSSRKKISTHRPEISATTTNSNIETRDHKIDIHSNCISKAEPSALLPAFPVKKRKYSDYVSLLLKDKSGVQNNVLEHKLKSTPQKPNYPSEELNSTDSFNNISFEQSLFMSAPVVSALKEKKTSKQSGESQHKIKSSLEKSEIVSDEFNSINPSSGVSFEQSPLISAPGSCALNEKKTNIQRSESKQKLKSSLRKPEIASDELNSIDSSSGVSFEESLFRSAPKSSSLKEKKTKKQSVDSKHKLNSSLEKPEIACEELNSIDSSSGLSFEESLFMSAPGSSMSSKKLLHKRKKVKPSLVLSQKCEVSPQQNRAFSQDILTSLSDIVDPGDVRIQYPNPPSSRLAFIDGDEDDGDLKFKSKKVLWAPRVKKVNRPHEDGDGNTDCEPTDQQYNPTSLIDLCLSVIERNISCVEHVGLLPYELFSCILAKIPAAELSRIEMHNPQYEGLTDDIWQRHVHRDFPENKNSPPKSDETWFQLYKRLETDRARRLNRFINKSTTKLIAEKEMRRTTLTTDVITPARIRRRAARELNSQSFRGNNSTQLKSQHFRGTIAISERNKILPNVHHGPGIMNFQPRNMSGPTHSITSSSLASKHNNSSGGNLLGKLRKKFFDGR